MSRSSVKLRIYYSTKFDKRPSISISKIGRNYIASTVSEKKLKIFT